MSNFEFDSILYPYNCHKAIKVIYGEHKVEEYVKYINENEFEQAQVVMPCLDFLKECPSLKYLHIAPWYNTTEKFDLSPLYELDSIKYLIIENEYGEDKDFFAELDCARLHGIEFLSVSLNSGIVNLSEVSSLKTLVVRGFKGKNRNLTDLFTSKRLDTLELTECKIESLDGIEQSDRMQCLYLHYNRSLKDISALKKVKNTLEALTIDACSKIEDFSVLEELERLEFLQLWGNNKISDLGFLKSMKNLKTFIFDYHILDGDLSACLNIPCVYCDRNRKHYNLTDKKLPKGMMVFGNENIDTWRRLE